MKMLFLTVATLIISLPTFAQGRSDRYESENDYRHRPQPPRGNDPCRYSSCQPRPRPIPQPRSFTCHVNMIDCYGQTVGRYWGRGPQYNGACQVAANLCNYDLRWYGQYGSRCVRVGK